MLPGATSMPPGSRVPASTALDPMGKEESSAASKNSSVVGILGRSRHIGKREHRLVECDMTGDDDPVRVEVKTPIALVFRRIPTERSEEKVYVELWMIN